MTCIAFASRKIYSILTIRSNNNQNLNILVENYKHSRRRMKCKSFFKFKKFIKTIETLMHYEDCIRERKKRKDGMRKEMYGQQKETKIGFQFFWKLNKEKSKVVICAYDASAFLPVDRERKI